MKKGRIGTQIFGIAVVLLAVGAMLGGLLGIGNAIVSTSDVYAASYDRQAAYNYAVQWWDSCNHDCSGDYMSCTPWSYWGSECCGYPSHGGDCANFVSQCLIAGGHPCLKGGDCKYPDGTLCCRGYPCGKEEISAKRLGDCLASMGWERTCGYHALPPNNVDIADVLIYHQGSCDGWTAHATIVTYVSGSDIRITCHSYNKKNEPYTYLSTSYPYYEWLHYPASVIEPTVETRPATDIAETAATINGLITDDGGASIDERRFDWGRDSSCSDDWTNAVTVSGNSFWYRLAGLAPDTTYYFRGWAHNSAGWSHGNVLSFTTVTPAFPDLIVDDIWTEPAEFHPGDTVKLWQRTRNIGTGDAVGTFRIQRYFDDTPISHADKNGLAAGVSYASYCSYTWPSDTNWHTIRLVADLNNTIAESNEGNNERSEQFKALPPPQYTLTINTSGQGTTNPSAGTHTYNEGTQVTITAYAASGWQFDHWTGTNNNSVNPTTVTMNSNKSVTAYFSQLPPTQYTLTTSVSPSGSGSVSPPGGTFDAGTVVTLTANPASCWQFDHWTGTNNNSVNPTTVTMNSNKSVTAYFTELPPTVDGIDVSHWQGDIDWSQVYNAGYRFAFAKATEGDATPPQIIDDYFETNMTQGRNAGMLMGAYHFAWPQYNDAADEAQFFVSIAGDYLTEEHLRPVLDLEQGEGLGITALSNWVHEWMNTVESLTGIEPIIYVNSNYASNYLNSSINQYDLWIAHWRCDTSIPADTGIWSNWDFWQYYGPSYCGANSVPGISGSVDLDIFNGDMSRLYTFVISGGDHVPPTVAAFSVEPSSVTLGSAFTVSYTVSDTGGSGLNRVELWRKSETVDWQEIDRTSLTGVGDGPYSGSLPDAPTSVGIYWYGIHVADNAGNWAPEDSPIQVEVTQEECPGTDTSCGIYPNCENCNASDGWVDTGNTQWVDLNDCQEKEQKQQQYRDYSCQSQSCTPSVTQSRWVDTGNTRNKPNGTDCGNDGWVDTGNTQWKDDPGDPCLEVEEKEQNYRDYGCANGSCQFQVTDTRWVATGDSRVKVFTLSTAAVPTSGGTVSPSGGDYDCGTEVPLEANENPGWQFDHWTGTNNNSANPTTVTMNSSKSVTAYFSEGGAPTATNFTGASHITSTSARLNGEITDTGGQDPSVHIYWGDNDGGTTPENWDHDVNLGTKGPETFYTNPSGLTPNSTYYYRCYATNGGGTDWADSTASFSTLSGTPTSAPTLSSPANPSNQPGTSVTFQWGPVDGATTYWLLVDKAEEWGSPWFFYEEVGTDLSCIVTGFPNDGTKFRWRVWGANAAGYGPGSAIWDFTNTAAPPPPSSAPTLVSPTDDATVSGTSVTFEWEAVEGATTYWLLVGKAEEWGSPWFFYEEVGTDLSCIVPGFPNDGTKFRWRVWGANAAGYGPGSAIWDFTNTGGTPPSSPPTLTQPADPSNQAGTSVTFEWEAVDGATTYWLLVDKAQEWGSPWFFYDEVGTDLSYIVSCFPNDGTKFRWRVWGVNGAGYGPGSAIWDFTNTGGTPPSSAPTLTSPADPSNQAGTSVTFEWEAVEGATTYWLLVDKAEEWGSPWFFYDEVGTDLSYIVSCFPNDGTKFRWRVWGVNGAGYGPGSAIWDFTNGTAFGFSDDFSGELLWSKVIDEPAHTGQVVIEDGELHVAADSFLACGGGSTGIRP